MTMVITDNAYDKGNPCVLYDNLFSTGILTASTARSGYPKENAISGTTWDFYGPSALGFSVFSVDNESEVEADCVFIDAHNLGSIGSTFYVQHSTDGVEFRYWRVAFNNVGAEATVGVIMIGKRLVFPNGIDSSYGSIPHSREYSLLGGKSDGGQFTSQMVIRKGASVSPTFPLLDAAWVDTDMKPFENHYNTGKTFAWAAMPAMFPDDMGYCQRPPSSGSLSPSYYEGGMYEEFTMNLEVYINE